MAVTPFPRYWATKDGGSWFASYQADAESEPVRTPSCKTKAGAMNVILVMHPRVCACGCGEETRGGEFRMGHDARHKSNLIKEALTDNPDALAEIERRGWLTHLDKAREIAARPVKEPTERRVEQAESNEEKAQRAHDRLNVIKAACLMLKLVGQYYKASGVQIRIDTIEEAVSIIEGGHPDLLHEVGLNQWLQMDSRQVEACWRMRSSFEEGSRFIAWMEAR